MHIKPVIVDLDHMRGRVKNDKGVDKVCAEVDFNVFYGVLSLPLPVVGPIWIVAHHLCVVALLWKKSEKF